MSKVDLMTGTTGVPDSSLIEWTESQAEALRVALASRERADGGMGYCGLAGFLFAVACSPVLVSPSEWIPAALGEEFEADERVMDLVLTLYDRINVQVLWLTPSLPAGIAVREDAMANFGPEAPLGQWAQGYAAGHMWLEEAWDAYSPPDSQPEAETFHEALGGVMMVLSFFSLRELAEDCVRESALGETLESFAPTALKELPEAMRGLAVLGRGTRELGTELARMPARSFKVGRNEPCPCGSGRKYKRCCGG